jgi:FixJ family two-component response regulator
MISESELAAHGFCEGGTEWRALSPRQEGRLSMLSMISVVDDDASVRAATDNLLSSHGYSVRTFASAEELLQTPQLHDFTCVIADVQMPGMSGLELLKYMRAQGYLAPVIFITAFPEESVRASALRAGAICFLAKPFAAPVLIDCVETALHRAGS